MYVGANALQLEIMHADLVELATLLVFADGRAAMDHDDVRHEIAGLWGEVAAVQALSHEAVSSAASTEPLGLMAKLAYTELNVALCEYANTLAGAAVGSQAPRADELVRSWHHALLWSRALTISGGSSEIIRSLIAQQALGLPRSWSRVH
jgi:alkylation response protein AidB-like acyl-CoA dehydrogenase